MFVRFLSDVVSMATSWDPGTFSGFCLAIKKDSTVWGFGGDGWGVFGNKMNLTSYAEWAEFFH
jgi:hypothetical protein